MRNYPIPLLGKCKLRSSMAKKMRRGKRSIVRNASKTMEKQMLIQAETIYNDPYIVLPKYDDPVSIKRFKKTRKLIEKIDQVKDDLSKLEKIANKKNLSAAIAGTMLIHHANKAPFLAAAPLSSGNVLYAQRGNATKEHLIGVQHTNDPLLRLFAIKDLALKYKLHIYSWDHSFISTGETANPPEEFVLFVMEKNNLKIKNNIATCSHIKENDLKNKKILTEPYLDIYWKSAKTHIGICQHCAYPNKNFIYEITKYMIEPNLSKDFEVEVIGKVIKQGSEINKYDTKFIDEYLSGSLFDKQMIQKNMNTRLTNLKESDELSYVLDGVSFGKNFEEFIDALHPNNYEKKALLSLLPRYQKSIVVEDVTPNAVIEIVWDDLGLSFLEEIVADKKKASDLYSLPDSPSQILQTAFEMQKHRKILQNLPSYENLPPIASYIHRIGKIYRTDGKEKMIIEAKKYPENTHGKSLCYAFLLSVNKAEDMKWKFKKDEVESGEFLQSYTDTFLTCDSNEYHQSFQDLLTYSGTSIDLDTYLIS